MRRPARIAHRPPTGKPASLAKPRVLALAAWTGGACRGGPTVPVTTRVRDSLVLRCVAKNQSRPGNPTDERCAR